MVRKPQTALLLASPEDTEAQFYEALQAGDLERLMAVWGDEDEVCCVHPGGPRVVGAAAIRASFEQIFARYPKASAIGFATLPSDDPGGVSLTAVHRMIAGAVKGLKAREARP